MKKITLIFLVLMIIFCSCNKNKNSNCQQCKYIGSYVELKTGNIKTFYYKEDTIDCTNEIKSCNISKKGITDTLIQINCK